MKIKYTNLCLLWQGAQEGFLNKNLLFLPKKFGEVLEIFDLLGERAVQLGAWAGVIEGNEMTVVPVEAVADVL